MFEGKLTDFRSEGGVVKTDEEKKVMAEKRRFKQNRDFKKRLDDEEDNAENDIRSFKFHSFEVNYKGEKRASSPKSRGDWNDRRDRNDRNERGDRNFRSGKNFREGRDDRSFRGDRDNRSGRKYSKPFDRKHRRDNDE